MFRLAVSSLVYFLMVASSFGQQVEVRGRFYADSLKIGEPVPFSLAARYPQNINLVFPDSTFAFAPFEFSKKKYFQTITNDSISYDSVVYYLASYEIDSLQKLRLPVFVLQPGDCTVYYSAEDTIFLKHMVAHVPDSVAAPQLPLKTQTSYLHVKWLLNYPILLIVGGVTLVAFIAGWIIFGKRIKKYFLVKRLQRNHQSFLQRFSNSVDAIAQSYSSAKAEGALVMWKEYMESLEKKPYTKFTSKEIKQMEEDDQLGTTLAKIDRMIYGGIGSETHFFHDLKTFSESKFNKKLEALRYE